MAYASAMGCLQRIEVFLRLIASLLDVGFDGSAKTRESLVKKEISRTLFSSDSLERTIERFLDLLKPYPISRDKRELIKVRLKLMNTVRVHLAHSFLAQYLLKKRGDGLDQEMAESLSEDRETLAPVHEHLRRLFKALWFEMVTTRDEMSEYLDSSFLEHDAGQRLRWSSDHS